MPESLAPARRTHSDSYDHLAPVLHEFAGLDPLDPRRPVIRDQLVAGFLPVAHHIARRFRHRGQELDDLIQVAVIGLIHAVDRFDPERGADFLTFAVPTVMGEVRKHFRDRGWAMRVPRRLKDLHLAIGAANTALATRLGRAATPSEIAEHLQVSKEVVYEGLTAGRSYRSESLDRMLTAAKDSATFGDKLGQEDHAFAGVDNHESLRPLLRQLPERERMIISMRFFGNLTQTQIAARIGVSQMHVSRLLAKAIAQLRHGMLDT
ncbi:MAG: RNA polymerase sigma factor SigF [Kibdelosporangium sp.]